MNRARSHSRRVRLPNDVESRARLRVAKLNNVRARRIDSGILYDVRVDEIADGAEEERLALQLRVLVGELARLCDRRAVVVWSDAGSVKKTPSK